MQPGSVQNGPPIAMTTPDFREAVFEQQIATCRKVALNLLKPSQRDLEVGLAIHRESLVVESYGLGIHAAQHWDRLQKAEQESASAAELRDLAEENGMLGHLDDAESKCLYLRAWEASGVSCTFQNTGEEGNQPLRLLKRLARYTHLIDAMSDRLGRGISVDDILENHRQGKRSIVFALNGVPLTGAMVNTTEEMAYIRIFAQLGGRSMHLTYNRRNPIGDGCGELHDGGLSDFGREVVAELNRVGIIIDLAHTGWKTCMDAAKASAAPVIVSHSAACALNQHIRCKPDEVIQAVVDTGGVFGVTNIPTFLGGTGTITAFLDHIDYVAKRFGIDAVSIGTDRACVLPEKSAPDPRFQIKMRKSWESLWPEGSLPGSPEWNQPHQVQSLAWTNWPLFTVGLVQRGYSEEAIRKIIGGNILRVAKAVWKTPSLTA